MTTAELASIEDRVSRAGKGTAYAEDAPALLVEVRRLQAENASDRAIQGEAEHRALERAEAAEARVRKLEAALRRISDGEVWTDTVTPRRVARAALAPDPDKELTP